MKIIYILLSIGIGTIFCSCSKELDIPEEKIVSDTLQTRAVLTFPPGEWGSWDKVNLVNLLEPVSVPWNTEMSATSIPDYIRFDIKRADGWDLLAETISRREPKMNYIIFYNRWTGILKGFYYLETASEGNNAFWQIGFEAPNQKLLYNQDGYFTYPHSLNKSVSDVSVMNVTNNRTKGFTEGWNCFLVEFAYDPNQPDDLILSISSYQQNVGSIELSGNFDSSSSGSIISSATSSSSSDFGIFNKANVTTMQKDATKWITDNISVGNDAKPIKNVGTELVSAMINGGIKAVATSGVGFLFSSFLGGTSSSAPTKSELQFSTTGKATLTGKTENPRTTSIPPLKIALPRGKKLGIWNLSSPPIVSVGRWAKVINASWVPSPNKVAYEYQIDKKIESGESLLLINPQLRGAFNIRYSVTYCYFSGHMEGEIYNLTSLTRKEVMDRRKRGNLRSDGKRNDYMTVLKYSQELSNGDPDERVEIRHQSQIGNKTLFYTTEQTVDLAPRHRATDNAMPYLDLQTAGYQTEDIKVLFEYTVSRDGVTKTYYSIRTYDPELVYRTNAVGCIPYQ